MAFAKAVDLPGTTANFVSTPDTAALSITSDIDVRAKIDPDDWTPAANMVVVSKTAGSNQAAYALAISTAGALTFTIYQDGANNITATSTASVGGTPGTPLWVRATWVNATNVTQFFTSSDGSSWTQLGTNVTLNSTGAPDTTAPVHIGRRTSGSSGAIVEPFAGHVYYVEIRSGVGGTVAGFFDASVVEILGTRNPSTVTNDGTVWTVNGTTWDWVENSAVNHEAAAALSGTGSLSAAAVKSGFGAVSLSGAGSLSATGARTHLGAALLTGVGSLSATGARVVTGAVQLAGLGSLTARLFGWSVSRPPAADEWDVDDIASPSGWDVDTDPSGGWVVDEPDPPGGWS